MELNEALRRTFAGHWRLLVCAVALPLLVVAALQALAVPAYVATSRIQASSTPPSTDTEADAVLNRVAGIATSPSVVNDALRQAGITNRNADQVAGNEVAVTRLGSSAVFNVSITDPSPQVATGLAGALGNQLVTFLNGTGDPRAAGLITQLTNQQRDLLAQRQQVAARLAAGGSALDTANLSAQLSTLDQQLNDIGATLRQLQSTVLTNGGSAAAISLAGPAVRAPSRLATDLGLAGIAGLVAGLLLATGLEMLRPRVSGGRDVARELGTVHLGRLARPRDGDGAPPVDDVTLVGLRETLTRTGTDRVVVAGPLPAPRLSAIAAELSSRLSIDRNNGDEPAAADGVPGAPGVAPQPEALAGHGRTATFQPVLELRRNHQAIEVRALPEIGTAADTAHSGLLFVTPDFMLHREVHGLRTLTAATGWPVLGVLGTRALRRRERGRRTSRRGARP
ncbi:hypothetical protein [Amycolatopsis granulosa]|uniref:hypothetical protein n=1 Tax=Amycolatopsis granulosa TaxID=185684 RepID=UPI00141DFE20|nr:hypothetical protein [Amycolatopsis granulosa]NIH83910.1 capsular polysaccharide biosynthesis protein [Amycolatopsis granulosa]